MDGTRGTVGAIAGGPADGRPDPVGSYLLVPAVRRLTLRQPQGWTAGAVIIDLGGPWPARTSADARELARALLLSHGAEDPRQAWVRIHPPWRGEGAADLATLRGLSAGLVVPEVRSEHELARLATARLPLIPVVETPEALLTVLRIARQPGVVRLAFSAAALAARLDAEHGWSADRWLSVIAWARNAVVAASRAAGLPGPINALQGEPEDGDRMRHDARRAIAAGFTAQCVTAADQLPVVHDLLNSRAG